MSVKPWPANIMLNERNSFISSFHFQLNMKLFSLIALAISAVISTAQDIKIIRPADYSSVTGGQALTVELERRAVGYTCKLYATQLIRSGFLISPLHPSMRSQSSSGFTPVLAVILLHALRLTHMVSAKFYTMDPSTHLHSTSVSPSRMN